VYGPEATAITFWGKSYPTAIEAVHDGLRDCFMDERRWGWHRPLQPDVAWLIGHWEWLERQKAAENVLYGLRKMASDLPMLGAQLKREAKAIIEVESKQNAPAGNLATVARMSESVSDLTTRASTPRDQVIDPVILARLEAIEAGLPAAPDGNRTGFERVVGVSEFLVAQDGDASIGGTNTNWKDVQGRLLAKRESGEPYTSLRTLADELDCSTATIRKAIKESTLLKGWQVRSERRKAAPKATDLGAVARDNRAQATESAPDDVLLDEDVDAIMARLINQAGPDERAKLNALDEEKRKALAAAYQAQNLDDEPSPLEGDTPGKRRRKVKQHKRV
jgi:biotin operon repressor